MLNYIVHIFIDFYVPYARFRPHKYSSHSILPAFALFGLAIGNVRLSLIPSSAACYASWSGSVSTTVKYWMWIVDRIYRLSDLIASVVCFDRFHRCLSLRTVVLFRLYISTWEPMHLSMTTHWRCGIVPLLIVFVDLYSRWQWCQYCRQAMLFLY